MALAPRPERELIGWVVYGGKRAAGGPAYTLRPPEGGYFPTISAARLRADEVTTTKDWWVEPVWKVDE